MGNNESSKDILLAILCFEAKRWVGSVEEGRNGGQLVKMFQRAVDNRAENEPWCMAFAQYCIKMTEQAFLELFPAHPSRLSSIFRSEHCLTVWNRSPQLQMRKPIKGSLCIWQKFNGRETTANGHAGIVTEVHNDGSLSVIEGNSSHANQSDGINKKCYSMGQMNHGSLFLKGFLRIWN